MSRSLTDHMSMLLKAAFKLCARYSTIGCTGKQNAALHDLDAKMEWSLLPGIAWPSVVVAWA